MAAKGKTDTYYSLELGPFSVAIDTRVTRQYVAVTDIYCVDRTTRQAQPKHGRLFHHHSLFHRGCIVARHVE